MKHKVSWKKFVNLGFVKKDVMNSLKVITAAGGQNSVTQMIGNLFVTSKNETMNLPIHEFKVLHKTPF
jgi:hypothetical protein